MAEHSEFSALSALVADKIAAAVGDADPPDAIYALVLAYSLGGLAAYVYPLYELSRAALLEAGIEPHALWDPSWASEDQLPRGVGPDLPDRDLDIEFDEDPDIWELFERYSPWPREGNDEEFDAVYEKIERLWLEVAARLTRLNWNGHEVHVTKDFVALAYPSDPTCRDIREALARSLSPDGYREFGARGWIPAE